MARPNTEELKLITEFRNRVLDVQLCPEQLEDHHLIRWIRARDHDLAKAEQMFRKSMIWRKDLGMDSIGDWTPPKILSDTWKVLYVGHDFENCPVYLGYTGAADFRMLLGVVSKKDLLKYAVSYIENMVRNVGGRMTPDGYPVTRGTLVVDFANFDMSTMLVSGFNSFMMDMAKNAEANYPEVMKKVLFVNSSKVVETLYSMMRPFLSDVTAKKVTLIGTDPGLIRNTLLQFMPPELLCPRFGGTRKECPAWDICCYYITSSGHDGIKPTGINDRNGTFKKVSIKAGGTLVVTLEAKESKSVLHWSVYIHNYNIKFGINFHGFPVIPYKMLESGQGLIEGSLQCDEVGYYELEFDNRSSKYRSKEITYLAIMVALKG